MTAKEIIIRSVDRVKQIAPNTQLEFQQGRITIKGKYTHRQTYTTVDGEEEACERMLEAIFFDFTFWNAV
jgi:hypothetical protein